MNKNVKLIITKFLLYIGLIALTIYLFFPMYWIILTSFRPHDEIFQMTPSLLIDTFTLENFVFALTESGIFAAMLNSFFVTIIAVLFGTTVCITASYALTKMQFAGKKFIYGLFASTQVFPVVVVIIPLYMMFRGIHLYNSLWSLILTYTAIYVPAGTVLMLSNFRDLPRDMEEAAHIDGCNRLQTLFFVLLPPAFPFIVATSIYLFISMWQEYLIASTLIGDKNLHTLTVALTTFQGEFQTNWGALMATAVIISIPAIVAFLSVQKYFIDNLAGSVKE